MKASLKSFLILVLISKISLAQTINITTPNSSTVWEGGLGHLIEWTSSGTGDYLKVEFYDGSSWTTFNSSTPDDSSYGTVFPNISTTNARVRITDNDSGLKFYSDVFTMEASKTITVTYPDNTTNVEGTDSLEITWTTDGPVNNVNIHYYDGSVWNAISGAQNITNSGSYTWIVANDNNTNAKIKVEDAEETEVYDESESFIITELKSITIQNPIAGEVIDYDEDYTINWNYTGTIDSVSLEFYDGSAWSNITGAEKILNNGSYLWSVPDIQTDSAKVKVTYVKDSTVYSVSDYFRISYPRDIAIVSPDSLSTWEGGTDQTINWNYTGKIDSVKIEYFDGATWNTIVGAEKLLNDSMYVWTVPNTPTDTALVKVIDYSDSSVSAVSDTFKILEQRTISFDQPISTTEWEAGTTHDILWTSTGNINNVNIEYFNDGVWTNIDSAQNIVNDSSFIWTIPADLSGATTLRISDVNDVNVYSESDEFTILTQRTLAITEPVAADTIFGGLSDTIKWNSTGDISFVDLFYSIDTAWIQIGDSTANDGSFEWMIPDSTFQSQVRIVDASDSSINDTSDIFQIEKAKLEIKEPLAGTVWNASSIDTIKWNTYGKIDSIMVSYFDGSIWTDLDTVDNIDLYVWNIPYIETDSAKVKLTDYNDTSRITESDYFSIEKPSLTLLEPNGGEELLEGNINEIQWTSKGNIQYVDLKYFDGSIWNDIPEGQNIVNDGSFDWTVPNANGDEFLVKVVFTNDTTVYDESDSTFSIISHGITTSPVRIMPLGNSITKDSYSGDSRTEGERTAYRYPLWDSLRTNNYNTNFVGSLYNGYDFFPDAEHEGHGGYTDTQIADSVYYWLTNEPAEIVLLHIGTNDLDTSSADVENILDEIDRYESDNSTEIWVVLARIIDRVPNSSTTTEFNDNIVKMIERRNSSRSVDDKVIIVDMEDGAGLDYTVDDTEPYTEGDFIDYLHPNSSGNMKIANQWFKKLELLLPPPEPTAPLITDIADTVITTIDETFTYDVDASGIGAPDYYIQAGSDLPDSVINMKTGLITWEPTAIGYYAVTVEAENSSGTDTESFIIYVQGVPPVIVEQPKHKGIVDSGSVTYTVFTQSELAMTYQWQENGVDISGATDSILTLTNLDSTDNNNFYNCVVTNSEGNTKTDTARLYVTNSFNRANGGQTVFYDFTHGSGNKVFDRSYYGAPLDLDIANTSNTNWLNPGLEILDASGIESSSPGTKIYNSSLETDEITLEAWIMTSNLTQSGPARIFTFSDDANNRNFTLGQVDDQISVRLRTTETSDNGIPSVESTSGSLTLDTLHVVYTRSYDGEVKIYINGSLNNTGTITGDFSNWNSGYHLGIGDEINDSRLWKGSVYLVSTFNRVLSQDEILHNYSVGFDEDSTSAPVITSDPILAASLTNDYKYNVDAQGIPTPTFSLIQNPTGMTIDSLSGLIQWNPLSIGDFNVTVRATNSKGYIDQSFTITVKEKVVSLWKLDEDVIPTTFEDSHGNNDGSSSAGIYPTPTMGRVNGAMSFDGGDEIVIPSSTDFDLSNNESLSLELWIKTTQSETTNKVFVGRYNSSETDTWWIGMNNGNPKLYLRDSDGNSQVLTGSSVINDGNWHHIVGFYDHNSNYMKIFVDGSIDDSISTSFTGNFTGNGDVSLGYLGSDYHVIGIMDEIAFYDRALLSSEISTHYNNGLSGNGYFDNNILLSIKAYLEGPFDTLTNKMDTTLNSYIPTTSPYSQDSITISNVPVDVVDWVLIELRDSLTGSEVASKSVFIKSDGNVVDTSGTNQDIEFDLSPGDYYVILRHRNHLDIISSSSVSLSSSSTLYDFTTASSKAYGSNSQKELNAGVFGLYGGDANGNNDVGYSGDILEVWSSEFGKTGYYDSDFNLNSDVGYSDDILVIWFSNFGKTSNIP